MVIVVTAAGTSIELTAHATALGFAGSKPSSATSSVGSFQSEEQTFQSPRGPRAQVVQKIRFYVYTGHRRYDQIPTLQAALSVVSCAANRPPPPLRPHHERHGRHPPLERPLAGEAPIREAVSRFVRFRQARAF